MVYDSGNSRPSASSRLIALFDADQSRSATEVAQSLGISRQAAHRQLASLVAAGQLTQEGRARASRYRRAGSLPLVRRYARAVLAEDRVWLELSSKYSSIGGLSTDARSVFQYAFTEMLNNVIEHSQSVEVEVKFEAIGNGLAFEIVDQGKGVFTHLRKSLRLPSELDALQELSKGKLTTLPKGHTGEGIFFTSKVADVFQLESGTTRWTVDNLRNDMAIGTVPRRVGTRVRFEAGLPPRRKLAKLFSEYSKDFEFQKTRVVVKLFAYGVRFISRSEARRVLNRLEGFKVLNVNYKHPRASITSPHSPLG